MKKVKQKNKGFSILELLVSIALFTVAIVTGAGLVLAISTAQKKAVSLQEIQDNIGFAFEAMSREIRTGKNYYCGVDNSDLKLTAEDVKDCPIGGVPDGGVLFSFVNQLGQTAVYRVFNGQLEKSSDGGSTFLALTSDKVDINNMKFYVYGSSSADDIQPKAIVVLGAKTGEKFVLEINLQTTISQRIIDY